MTELNTLITPEMLEQTMNLVQKSIDQGIPVLSFDLFIPEFGVIYGYDDEKQVFSAKDVSQDGYIPYSKVVGERLTFLVAIDESIPHSKYEMLSPSIVTCRSSIDSRTLDCVRGVALLISSASRMFVNTGPLINSNEDED